jgi:hypothetical protein
MHLCGLGLCPSWAKTYPLMGWIHQIRTGPSILYVLFILFSDTHWIHIYSVSDTYPYPIHIHRVSASLATYRCFVADNYCFQLLENWLGDYTRKLPFFLKMRKPFHNSHFLWKMWKYVPLYALVFSTHVLLACTCFQSFASSIILRQLFYCIWPDRFLIS